WIPLHSDVVREGFFDFLRTVEGGPLFRRGLQSGLAKWVNSAVFHGQGDNPPPNHGWRHFMESLIRRYDVSIRAGLYLTGRALGKDADDLMRSTARSYGTDELALLRYAAEMEKIEPILSLSSDAERITLRPFASRDTGSAGKSI